MVDAKSVASPADPIHKLDKSMAPNTEAEIVEMKNVPYKEAI